MHSSQTTVKTHWVPPPGRTTHRPQRSGNTNQKKSTTSVRNEDTPSMYPSQTNTILETNELEKQFEHLPDIEVENLASSKESSLMSSPVPAVANQPLIFRRYRQEAIEKSKEFLRELKLLRTHRELLKSSIELLKRPIKMKSLTGDQVASTTMIAQAEIHVQTFFDTFEEVTKHVDNFETDVSQNWEEYVGSFSEYQEQLKVQILIAYESVMVALKFLFDIHIHGHLPALHNEHLGLRHSVESVTGRLDSMQHELEESKQQIRTLLHEKAFLETLNQKLQSNLEQSEMLIQKFHEESQNSLGKSEYNFEKLHNAMQVQKNQHTAEKEALKKAIKFQKLRADQLEVEINDLKIKLNEKDSDLYSIAADRDRWKMDMTSLNNKLIEKESLVQELFEKTAMLQDKIEECESSYQLELRQMKLESQEKAVLIDKFQGENEEVRDSASHFKKKLQASEMELETLRLQHDALKGSLNQPYEPRRGMEDELKAFVSLLQEMQKKNFQPEPSPMTPTDNIDPIYGMIKEIKDHLVEVRNLYQFQKNGNSATDIMEQVSAKHNEIPQINSDPRKRVGILEAELHRLRSISSLAQSQGDGQTNYKEPYSRFDGHLTRESNFNFPSGDNRWLTDEKTRQHEQLLLAKDREIASLEHRISDVERKYTDEMKEMKNKLINVTSNHESLQKYVKILKSSYNNVFGVT